MINSQSSFWNSRTQCVYIVDADAIVEFKLVTPLDVVWSLLLEMDRMVEQGILTFPLQVYKELTEINHPDAPGTWAAGVWSKMDKALTAPTQKHLVNVVNQFPSIDGGPNEERDIGDPYVVALALTLKCRGYCPIAASGDNKVVDACISLGISVLCKSEFIELVQRRIGGDATA